MDHQLGVPLFGLQIRAYPKNTTLRDIVNHDSLSDLITLRYHNCPMDLNRLGNAIRTARKAAGFKNQTELGRACGWTDAQTRISNYERGDREPTLADIEAIAKATRLTLIELLTNAFGERRTPASKTSYKRYPKVALFINDLMALNNEPFINDVIESARVSMEGLAHTRYAKWVTRIDKGTKTRPERGKEPPKESV